VANAHSADLLPRGRIAVAASHDPQGTGDRLIIFDLAHSEEPVWQEELPWGHGAVWDDERGCVWALEASALKVFRLADWNTNSPRLELEGNFDLPETTGHDLAPVPGTSLLTITTTHHCWQFDRDEWALSPFVPLADVADVKCISVHPETGRIAYVRGDGEHWWNERVEFLGPAGEYCVAGEHFYKVRWSVAPL
jgi:hypothetical protein